MTSAPLTAQQTERLQKALRIKSSEYWPYPPSRKQAAFLWLPHIEALYGGAAGGGKSDALLMAALQYADVPGYSALILRKTFQQLSKADALIPRSKEWLAHTDAHWNGTEKRWTFPSGATLEFGYLQHSDDRYNYQGAAFQFVGFDEVVDFKEADYRFLFGRLRRLKGSKIPLRIRAACNPIGPGLEWVKRRFVDSDHDDRMFVPANLQDNPGLDKEEYRRSLEVLPPLVRQALLEGDWTIRQQGGVFERESLAENIVDRITEPIITRVRFWDLAGTAPSKQNADPDWTVGVRLARGKSGSIYVEDVARCRRNPDGVERLVSAKAREDGRETKVRIEQEPGQSGKAQVNYFVRHVLQGYDVDGVRASGSKVTRAGPFAAQVRAHNVKPMRAPWNTQYFDELEAFPNASHDDQVDASTGAYNVLVEASTVQIEDHAFEAGAYGGYEDLGADAF